MNYLMNDRADISINSMSTCCNRTEAIEFSNVLYTRDFSVVFQQPDLIDDIFLVQFSPMTWYALAAIMTFLMLSMLAYQLIKGKELGPVQFDKKDVLSWILCNLCK